MSADFRSLDFLPTLTQRRRGDFRRQCRIWIGIAVCGALAATGPIVWDIHQRREAQTQREAMREASEKLGREKAAFDLTGRRLAGMHAHRSTVVALVARRQSPAYRMLDVMRACADGVRLTLVKTADEHLRIEGYATTQSRVRETQKRLRALPWVRKVAEVESSVVPEGLRRQWVGASEQATVPIIRRFTLRIDIKPVASNVRQTGISHADGGMAEEVIDVR